MAHDFKQLFSEPKAATTGSSAGQKDEAVKTRQVSNPKKVRQPKRIGDLIIDAAQGDMPFDSVYSVSRTHRFTYWRTTEPCIDLKLFIRHEGRLNQGERLKGVLTRDGDGHYLFVESLPEKKRAAAQKPVHVYRGHYINVTRRRDGELRPSFTVPAYTQAFTFKYFCLKAAEELLEIARKLNAKEREAGS